jgi:Na+-driven multidrug efflux pump
MGIPTAVTNFVVMFGVIILSFVTNKMGTEYIAGYSCASKMGYIITAPLFGFATAASVFVSQNMGARNFDRIKEGVRKIILLTTAVNVGLFILTKAVARPILNALLSGETVGVEAGLLYLDIRTVAMFWLTLAAVYKSVIVALGKPFLATVSGFLEIGVRYLVPIILAASLGFAAVPMTDAITWLMLAVFLTVAYMYEFKKIIKGETLYDKQ